MSLCHFIYLRTKAHFLSLMTNTLMKSPVVVVRHVPSYPLPKFHAVIKRMKIAKAHDFLCLSIHFRQFIIEAPLAYT